MDLTRLQKLFTVRSGHDPLPMLVNSIMVLLIGWQVWGLASHALKPLHTDAPVESAPATGVIKKPAPASIASLGQSLSSMDLFGNAKESAAADKKAPITAPDTRLELTLRGIFAQNEKHDGLAIIQNKRTSKEEHFVVKDNVFGMATLKEIYHDRVILYRNGKYETLRLPEKSLPNVHYLDSKEIKAEQRRVASNYRNRLLNNDGMDLIKLFGFL